MALWPQALIFDFDGTLVNSEPLHFYAISDVLRAEKIEVTEQEYYQDLVGVDDRQCFEIVFRKAGRVLDPKTSLRVLTRKRECMMRQIRSRKYKALPGVEEFVRAVWRHYPLAVCSAAQQDEIDAMLQGISLRDCFPTIVSAEDVANGKPDPESYLLAVERLSERLKHKLTPQDCLVIEDAPAVIGPTRQAGFPLLAVASTYPIEKLTAADWCVQSLRPEEVQDVLPGIKMYL